LSQPKQRTADAPIGVFDSGMGGLSVVKELRQHLPHERMVYLADTKHVPYGGRSDDEIRQLTAQAVHWLYQQGCKLVVVACNTASAFSLTPLREYYGEALPIVGLVPAVKPAVFASKSKKIGVLATIGTLRGTLLQEVIREVAVPAHVEVITAVSPKLVPFVEAGEQNSNACRAELLQVLTPLAQVGVDQLVLGCTHYPFLMESIRQLFADQFGLVDSGAAVARQTGRLLDQYGLRSGLHLSADQLRLQCFVTGCLAPAQSVMESLIDDAFDLSPTDKVSADQV
jgi:glutamate racemase